MKSVIRNVTHGPKAWLYVIFCLWFSYDFYLSYERGLIVSSNEIYSVEISVILLNTWRRNYNKNIMFKNKKRSLIKSKYDLKRSDNKTHTHACARTHTHTHTRAHTHTHTHTYIYIYNIYIYIYIYIYNLVVKVKLYFKSKNFK